MLNDLTVLARQSSADKRRALMSEITDLFLEGVEKYSDHELFLFAEILSKLLDDVDLKSKKRLSEKIASTAQAPRKLVALLANQEIAIARPVLEQSPVLEEPDLLSIARSKTPGHRVAISKRDNLTEQVTDALISYQEPPVARSVCKNPKSQISLNGFDKLVHLAEADYVLRNHLSRRPDIPQKLVNRVWALLRPRDQLKFKMLIDTQGEHIIDDLFTSAKNVSSNTANENSQRQEQTKLLLSKILVGETNIGPVVEQLCKENRLLDVGTILAGIAGVPDNVSISALSKRNGRAIIVLCRALDIPNKAFQAILMLRQTRMGAGTNIESHLIKQFNELDIAVAQRTLRYLKIRLQTTPQDTQSTPEKSAGLPML